VPSGPNLRAGENFFKKFLSGTFYMFSICSDILPGTSGQLPVLKSAGLYLRDYISLYVTICFCYRFSTRCIYMLNTFSNTLFDFGDFTCLRYGHLRAHELKAVSHVLSAEVGTVASGVARRARGRGGVSELMEHWLRSIEGLDVETFAHKSGGGRDRPAQPAKSSDAADPKGKGWQGAREDSV
jgi:hypothetical protein